jgi:uncharacterized membrane protein YphA (DoxX/SURF4 family)
MILNRATDCTRVFLRVTFGVSFLSAVADRLGFWGAHGQPNVLWGNLSRFIAYAGMLTWFAPAASIPALAWAETLVESLLGLALIVGFFTQIAALLSGLMLLSFASSMTFAFGVKATLDLSLFSASAGALLLAAYGRYPLSIDELRRRRKSTA